jgi:H+-translocating NAD(P) transhydrogenase subunit alpha
VIIGVPKEIYPGDRRVALVPAVLPTLTKAGFEVHIQSGAGRDAGYPDSQYADKGAKIVADRAAIFAAADIVVQLLCYGSNDINGKQDLPLFAAIRYS